MTVNGDVGSSQTQPLTYQRFCDLVAKLEMDNQMLREKVFSLTETIMELKHATGLNTSQIKGFSNSFTSETAGLKSHLESIIEHLEGLDTIKVQQSEIATKHPSLILETEQKVQSWASLQ